MIVKGTINVKEKTLFHNETRIDGELDGNGDMYITGNITSNGSINLYGQLIHSLPEYQSNYEAENARLPINCLYRTGGIVKIRL